MEKANEEIESELNVHSFNPLFRYITDRSFKPSQALYPSRDVKDFRVVVARDAYTDRKPPNRMAQITVWNVMSLVFEEGGDGGDFKVGKTFLVCYVESCFLRARFANRQPGVQLASQSAGVVDEPSYEWGWNSLPRHWKADTLDPISMITQPPPGLIFTVRTWDCCYYYRRG